MKYKFMKNKLVTTFQVCAFALLTTIAFNAHAEYYIVYPDSGFCNTCCSSYDCYGTPVVYMHFKSHRAHNSFGSQEMSEYGWIPDPNGPQSATTYSAASDCDP